MKIEELFYQPEYELVVFYLKEHGILFVSDLEKFDFSELLFVPGLSSDIVSSAEAAYSSSANLSTNLSALLADNAYYGEKYSNSTVADNGSQHELEVVPGRVMQPNPPLAVDCHDQAKYADTPITEIYQGIPRCNPFIGYCIEHKIKMMSELTESDFENATGLRGLGKHSADVLRQVWIQFTNCPPHLSDSYAVLADPSEIETVFGGLPHGGALIRYCKSKGWTTLSDMMDFSFDAAEIKGIGPATMRKLHQAYLDTLSKSTEADDLVYPGEIASQNMALPITVLEMLGAEKAMVTAILRTGVDTVQSLAKHGITRSLYIRIKDCINQLSNPITDFFYDSLHGLKNTAYQCLLRKAQGDTLQAIADDIGLTRERVRQINSKSCRILSKSAELAVMPLHANGQPDFSGEEIAALFSEPESAVCCKFILREGTTYTYIQQADKFVSSDAYDGDVAEALSQYVTEVIGNGLNFFEELENIEERLKHYHMDFFDFEDVMKYLVGNGYHFYGDYVVKGKGSYAPVCYDAILKYFTFDIKLDSDADNDDIKKLRSIIERRYSGLILPEGNRALCARLASIMVLSDRGRYCPAEKIIYSADLMEEIYNFIQNSEQTTFYYTELFSCFQGRLFAETNITNPNFLHGVLKYLYPDDYSFERDLLVKSGAERQDVNMRLCELLSHHGSPMSKAEILAAIPGLNDFVLAFAVARLPELIQWNYGYFNHIDNLQISDGDRHKLFKLINDEITCFHGYLSEEMLYRRVKMEYPEFLKKNNMESSQNLYYTCAYLFSDTYRFRRPHILSQDFPVGELTIENIARELLGNRRALNYKKFVILSEKLGWANGTFYSVFSELEKDYIRISEDDYISKDSFAPSERFLDNTAIQIGKYVDESGYFAISSIFNYDSFPDCNMPWNSFLLQSLIDEYNLGYRIIAPQVKDRRYQRGIIIQADMPVKAFEDLVLLCLHKDGITVLSELEMEKYLRNRGLIMKIIPQELYDCPMMPFKNDVFTIR